MLISYVSVNPKILIELHTVIMLSIQKMLVVIEKITFLYFYCHGPEYVTPNLTSHFLFYTSLFQK